MGMTAAAIARKALLSCALLLCAALPPCALAAIDGGFFDGSASAVPEIQASAIDAPALPSGAEVSAVSLPPVAFTSDSPISPLLIRAIDGTRASLQLLLYDINLPEVFAAIERAAERKVAVQVVIDEGHAFPARRASAEIEGLLGGSGIEVRTLRGLGTFGTLHNKIGIFDQRSVEFGSFNWTKSADTKNYENALFTTDPRRVALYRKYWDWVWSSAAPAGDGPHGAPSLRGGPPQAEDKPVGFNGAAFPLAAFSPGGGTLEMILAAIRASRASIDIAMFSFTQQEVADALLESKENGVRVRLVVDKSQSRSNPQVIDFLRRSGFDLRVCSGKGDMGVMHNKYAVFDDALIETGSYNWTRNAETNNFENADFSDEASLVGAFAKNFSALWDAAGPDDGAPLPPGGSSSLRSGR